MKLEKRRSMEKTKFDLFIRFKNSELSSEVLKNIKQFGSWERYTITVYRGWSNISKKEMEIYLYENCGYKKNEIEVIYGNPNLFMIR